MQVQLAAAHILKLVIDHGVSLDEGLQKYLPKVGRNRAELQAVSYGACRFYCVCEFILQQLLKKPIKPSDRIVHFLLICAVYQIDHMRKPDYATVNQTVNMLDKSRRSWAKKLVNGVLRNYLRQKESISASIPHSPARHAFPEFWLGWLAQSWPEHYHDIVDASNQAPPMTLRVNATMGTRDAYGALLKQSGIEFSLTCQSAFGITLHTPMPVERVPGFMDGRVSVQDESAQLVTAVMDLQPGQRVLDGCAAPGGKTCAILEYQTGLQSLVAIDQEKRIPRIRDNLRRLKLDAEVIASDLTDRAAWWTGRSFDRILLDVPCSGSGIIRRHPDIKHRRHPGDFEKFSDHQLSLLDAVWPTLISGGLLLYVTCSVLEVENDQVIQRFIDQVGNAAVEPLEAELGISTRFGRQRLPGVHSGDGFYFCRLKKLPGKREAQQ